MNLPGFGDRLLRELKRNKAKSAALGVLCLVACYFWLPLVMKAFKKNDESAPVGQSVGTTLAVAVQPATFIDEIPEFAWKEFLEWMSHERRMTVVGIPPATRDPFGKIVSAAAVTERSDGQAVTAIADPEESQNKSPAAYGMVLKGTIVGGNKSTANINGTIFRVGSRISFPGEISDPSQSPDEGFRLLEVKARYVVLESQGQLFRLELPPPANSNGNIMIRSDSD